MFNRLSALIEQVSKNEFLINIFENPEVVSKMYVSEISKFKILYTKAQKRTIL